MSEAETSQVVDTPFEDFVRAENAREFGAPEAETKPEPEPKPVEGDEKPIAAKVEESDGERNNDGTFKPKGKPRNDPRARVEDATAKEATAKRERDEARADAARDRAEAARLRAELDAARAPKAPVKPSVPQVDPNDPEPQLEQFAAEADPYLAHVRAVAKWEARQEHKIEIAKQREAWERAQVKHAEVERGRAWQERLTATRAKMPDFDSRINLDVPLSAPMMDVVKDSPVGPELLIHFSEHPDDAQRILTLHPLHAIREMGKLEERFTAASQRGPAPKPQVSQANAPIKPLGGSSVHADSDDGDVSFEEHVRRENKREGRAGIR